MAYGMDIISPFLQKESKYIVSYITFILAILDGASFSCNTAKSPENINLVVPRNGTTDNVQVSFLMGTCICLVFAVQTRQNLLSVSLFLFMTTSKGH